MVLTCDVCGHEFARRARGPIARSCSASCRAEKARRAAKQDGRHELWLRASRERLIAATHRIRRCRFCDAEFSTARSDRVTCGSAACRRALATETTRPYVARSHAIKRGAPSATAELFDPIEIFERDDWTCGICGDPVDRELAHPHPLSASLDHIEPVRAGGAHTRDNTQCSHFICNSLGRAPDAGPSAQPPREEAEQAA